MTDFAPPESYLRLPLAARRRGFGNSGGDLSFAILYVFASLFVIPRFSRSDSLRGVILHPIVLNNSVALKGKLQFKLQSRSYLAGLSCKS